jgi:hypothetical protein
MNLLTAHGLERSAPNVGVAKERSFESLLKIPETHRLVPVRSRSRGGTDSAVYWEFEEYDQTGRLVARYETFDERSAGSRHKGCRKFDGEGHLISGDETDETL